MKKGFTIAEMLGVVIILCIIAIIAFPPILNLIKKTENELDDSTKDLVITSSTQYITRHSNEFKKQVNSEYYIYIEDLIREKLISNNLIENTDLKLDSCVKVNVDGEYKYNYNIEFICSKERN